MADAIWSFVRGQNKADPRTALLPDQAISALDVLLEPNTLGRRRPSLVAVGLTSGPSSTIYQVARYQPAASSGAAELFAFSGTSSCHRYDQSSWASVSLIDTPATFVSNRPYAITHNGKLFMAYNSDQNRLHVYDNGAVRRVGVISTLAATVANTGAGAYAATLRYYKIQFRIYVGTNLRAVSELSPSVSFTPSGGGTDARITKPTTPDSATHWVVYGSADGVTYYGPVTNSTFTNGLIPVATTTFDDRTTVSAYSALDVAPSAGLNVPPPSAKFLLSDGNRLLMAGSWESSAASSETSPRNSRVWFTDVIGARDDTGEDETIPQTATQRNWVDVGENDGDAITGLAGPLEGSVYVFKSRNIWRLTPTGMIDAPYRVDRVTSGTGVLLHHGWAIGEDGTGAPALYFMSTSGPKRIVAGYGIEDIGRDLRDSTGTTPTIMDTQSVVVWDADRAVVWFVSYGQGETVYAFQPEFEQRSSTGVRYGWTSHNFGFGDLRLYAATMFESSGSQYLFVAGGGNGAAIAKLTGALATDADGGVLTPLVYSQTYQPFGLLRRGHVRAPVIEWMYPGAATAITVAVASVIDGPVAVTGTASATTTSTAYSGSPSVVQERLQAVQLSDVTGFEVRVSWDTSVNGTSRPRIHGVTIPVSPQEPA